MKRPLLWALTVVSLALSGCQSPPNRHYVVELRGTQPAPAEELEMARYRSLLPARLWLPASQMQITPAAGCALVAVTCAADDPARDSLLEDVAAFNADHPLYPVRLVLP